ncbi:histidine--tRNA ligase [Euzebya tangerina]|uniref:histidine--tRNA ligase n=1 Tax=Euzebya tangerina TaxID=591198 RepID=UPI000E31BB5B|nr:histidine--tRNA ligase [Euzebya tangerina]
MDVIPPRTPPGTMELLPLQQVAFQLMVARIQAAFERFGFLPIETPAFEVADVLLSKSGGETEKQVYFVQSTGSLEQGNAPDLALRFDLTVPTARYVAEHEHDLAFPFRRYQIQRVYRGERAQKGRYREFLQCDIDVIGRGSLSVQHDAEIPALIHQVFTDLDIGGFEINLNNRKVLKGLFTSLGVADAEAQTAALRTIDKLDKLPPETVRSALTDTDIGLSEEAATSLLTFADFQGDAAATLAHLDGLGIEDPVFAEGVGELRTVAEGLTAYGIPESQWRINLAIARGLDYYTGTVYETFLTDHRGIGSVCSGGRYDDLASLYTKSTLPGVGISIGLTRLFYALDQAGLVADASTVDVLVTQMDPALSAEYAGIGRDLRDAGLNTEVHLQPAKLGKQLAYADRIGARFAVILGSRELEEGVVTVKDLTTGGQESVPRGDLAAALATR